MILRSAWRSLRKLALPCAGIVAAACCGCSSPRAVQPHMEEPFPKKLSDWHLFAATSPALQPNSGVVPYDLNTPLFSDYAGKYRFV
jgi:hypothetical protein